MGYPSEFFKNQAIDDEFICSICHDVLRDPVVTVPCDHLFCKECIGKWDGLTEDGEQTCPVDRAEIQELKSPLRSFLNMLNKLEVFCPFKGLGCSEGVGLGDLASHEEGCLFNPEGLVECGEGCEATLQRGQVEDHKCLLYLKEVVKAQDLKLKEQEAMLRKQRIGLMEQSIKLKQQEEQLEPLRELSKEEVIKVTSSYSNGDIPHMIIRELNDELTRQPRHSFTGASSDYLKQLQDKFRACQAAGSYRMGAAGTLYVIGAPDVDEAFIKKITPRLHLNVRGLEILLW